jgi:hypothetical protein
MNTKEHEYETERGSVSRSTGGFQDAFNSTTPSAESGRCESQTRAPGETEATAPRRITKEPIFYHVIVRDDAVVVFAVIHVARHDRHWRERL